MLGDDPSVSMSAIWFMWFSASTKAVTKGTALHLEGVATFASIPSRFPSVG